MHKTISIIHNHHYHLEATQLDETFPEADFPLFHITPLQSPDEVPGSPFEEIQATDFLGVALADVNPTNSTLDVLTTTTKT